MISEGISGESLKEPGDSSQGAIVSIIPSGRPLITVELVRLLVTHYCSCISYIVRQCYYRTRRSLVGYSVLFCSMMLLGISP